MDSPTAAPQSVPAAANELPNAVMKAAHGEKLSAVEERDALHFFLTAAKPPAQAVDVDYLTPDGMKKLTFIFNPLTGRKIEEIENRHRKGDGPFAKLDQQGVDAELVAEATTDIVDAVTMRGVSITSDMFLQRNASPVMALLARFQGQEGLIGNIAAVIRGVSGWSPDRVSEARSVPVVAVGE